MPLKSAIITTSCMLILVLISQLSFANNIKGFVKDNNNKPIEYFTAAILSPQDSSILTGGAFMDGIFEFTEINANQCLLQLSCVGYQSVTLPIDFTQSSSTNLGTILMKNLKLNEVTVLAKRPTFKQVEGRLIINVKGTSLSQAGDLFDALKRSPGLIVDNDNNISVFGKGKPIVFINNREVQNNIELEALQSDDILSIEIDRNPSAAHSASGKAVVRIKTNKITKDQMNLQLYHLSYFAKRYRNKNGIQLNSKIGKTTSFISYSYSDYKYKNYEEAYEINHQENYIIDNKNTSINRTKSVDNNLFASINQEINDKHNLGFQYSYISGNSNIKYTANQTITKTNKNETKRYILKNGDDDNNLQTYNLNYEFNSDSLRSLSVISDYTKVRNNSFENIDEQNITNKSNLKTLIDNKNEYNIYSGKIDYKTPVFDVLKLQSGIKLSNVENLGKVISTDKDSGSENYNTEDRIKDRITATYLTLHRKFKQINMEGGLRYEYTNTDIRSNGITVLDSAYANWFPSFLVNKKFSDQLDITLSYSKKIDRPSFNELSTDISYFDSLSYSVGNPTLKPTTSHNIDLTFDLFRGLSVNLSSSIEKNARIMGAVNDKTNPDIVRYTPVNIDNAKYLYANIDYNYAKKHLNSTISLGVEKPFIEIPYLENSRKVRKLSWYFQTNNDYSISDRTSILAKFSYYSSSEYLMTHIDNSYNLSLGLNTSFFEKKLKVSLFANDILNSSDNAWEDKYGNIVAGLDPDYDNTWVRISIKYNFNHFRGGLKKKSASESELNRL